MSYAVGLSPLDGLVVVFAITTGAVVSLFAIAAFLGWQHRSRRRHSLYAKDALMAGAMARHATVSGSTVGFERAQVLTVGDLAADRVLLGDLQITLASSSRTTADTTTQPDQQSTAQPAHRTATASEHGSTASDKPLQRNAEE